MKNNNYGYDFMFPIIEKDESKQKHFEWNDLLSEIFSQATDTPILGDLVEFCYVLDKENFVGKLVENMMIDYNTTLFQVVARKVLLQVEPDKKEPNYYKYYNVWKLYLKPCFEEPLYQVLIDSLKLQEKKD